MQNVYLKTQQNRQELVNKIISNMEKGYVFTPDCWNHAAMRPYNPTSDCYYKGGNRFKLMSQAIACDYQDPRWCTLKQANYKGWSVKPGEHGVQLEKWIFSETKERYNPDTCKNEKIEVPLSKPRVNIFTVFNGSQLRNIPEYEIIQAPDNDLSKITRTLHRSSECEIHNAAIDRSFYRPSEDKIFLPLEQAFKSQEAYLATLIHEMGHSTGHPSRLNRVVYGEFGSADYAKEELRAELSAAFLQSDLGLDISPEQLQDHANYLSSWIQILKNDPNELFRASKDAELMSDRLLHNYEKCLTRETAKVSDINSLSGMHEVPVLDSSKTYFSIFKNADNDGFDLYKLNENADIVNINEPITGRLSFDAAYYKMTAYDAMPNYEFIDAQRLHVYAKLLKDASLTPDKALNIVDGLNLSADDKQKAADKIHELAQENSPDRTKKYVHLLKKKSYGNDLCDQYDSACNLISKYNLTDIEKSHAYKTLNDMVHTHFKSYDTDTFISTKEDIKSFLNDLKQQSNQNNISCSKIQKSYDLLGHPISPQVASAINHINKITKRANTITDLQKICKSAVSSGYSKELTHTLKLIDNEFSEKGYFADIHIPIAPDISG